MNGKLVAVTAGTMAPVVLANPEVFDRARVHLPDDATWTWEQLRELGAELTAKLPNGSYGVTDFSGRDAAFRVWVRQRGQETFVDGKVGFDAETAAAFFSLCRNLRDAKASPPASLSAEDVSAPVTQRLFAVGRTALAIYSSNQISAFDAATKQDVKLLRLPSLDGTAKGAKLSYQAAMYWTATSGTQQSAQVIKLIDFLVNDVGAAKILRTERGVPANSTVLAAIQGSLSASDRKALAYLERLKPDLAPPPPLTPKGGSRFEDSLIRHGQDVLFDRSSPGDAAAAFVQEITASLG